jgi:hypothetical protein
VGAPWLEHCATVRSQLRRSNPPDYTKARPATYGAVLVVGSTDDDCIDTLQRQQILVVADELLRRRTGGLSHHSDGSFALLFSGVANGNHLRVAFPLEL